MKKLLGALLLTTILTGGLQAQDDRYVLTATDASGPSGSSVTVEVLLDVVTGTAGAPLTLQGWSYGLCHDQTLVDLTSLVDGSLTTTVNAGSLPDFNAMNAMPVPGDGFTIGVVIDFFGVAQLAPGTNYELNVATYDLIGPNGSTTTLDFCDTLATPAVETLVVEAGGSSAIPVQNSGTITIGGGPVPMNALIANDVTGSPGTTVIVSVTMDNPNDPVEGFSFGLLHDSSVAALTSIDEGTASAATNGGAGADFFFGNIAPALPAGATGGGFVGQVVSLSPPFDTIPAGTGQEVATFSYNLVGSNGDMTAVGFSDQVGNPPVAVVLSINGGTATPMTTDGSIEVIGVTPDLFIRGDGNDDGVVDVSDVVFIAKWLFNVGPAGACDDAADVNDNGSLDAINDPMFLLAYLFQNGPAPAAPFPNCGADGTPTDALDCVGPLATCP